MRFSKIMPLLPGKLEGQEVRIALECIKSGSAEHQAWMKH